MAETRIVVRARVRVQLCIDVSNVWGGDCALAQVREQAVRIALGRLSKLVEHSAHAIEGEPLVTAVIVEEGRD